MNFSERFNFCPNKHLFLGIERECFLTRDDKIAPIAPEVLQNIGINGEYGYELSACQLEIRTKPVQDDRIEAVLADSQLRLREKESLHGFKTRHVEVAPYDMPLDVYPDPSGRYQRITEKMPEHILRAACMVAGTHVHVGMRDRESAVKAYNEAIKHMRMLCRVGDKSNGERLKIYTVMAPNYLPRPYKDWGDYEAYAVEAGFQNDPRSCWHLIRISVHGTVEFRMFGATEDTKEVTDWALLCHAICKSAL